MPRIHLVHKKLVIVALVFLVTWIFGSMLLMHFEEGYPIGASYFNAFYFTVITTATIGFGDLVPMTVAGKIFTMGYAIFYVPLFLYAMTLVFQYNFERIRKADERMAAEMHEVEKDVEIILDETKRTQRMIAEK